MNVNKKMKLIEELKSLSDNKEFFAKDGEEFEGDKNCIIWTGVEEPFKNNRPLADEYGNTEKTFQKFLTKHKLCYEMYDAGTMMIYKEVRQ